jgi:uncharacterized membrane protein YfcA
MRSLWLSFRTRHRTKVENLSKGKFMFQNLYSSDRSNEALLKIKMLGLASRRYDLAREAEAYYEMVATKGGKIAIESSFRRRFLAVPASFVAIAIFIIICSYETGNMNIAVWATVFQASMLSSVVGFAFSAIAGAILFHIDASYLHAVQTMLVASISMQSYSVFYLRENINLRALAPFLAGGAATLMLGAYVVTHSKPEFLLVLIGTFLVLYGLYTFRGTVPRLESTGVTGDVCAGALGGITGPVAAFPGPFVTIWCGLKGWDKSRQRGVAQPYILIMQIFSLGALSVMSGSQTAMDWPILQYTVPAIAGARFGLKLFERLNDRQFLSMIAAFLILSGIAMVAKVL